MTKLPDGVVIVASALSLAASTEAALGVINCDNIRTATATCRIIYGGGATTAATLRLYFSPDGVNFDTVPFASFSIDLTAGATVQESGILDLPEKGFCRISLLNGDAASTGISLWYSLAHYDETYITLFDIQKKLELISKLQLDMGNRLDAFQKVR